MTKYIKSFLSFLASVPTNIRALVAAVLALASVGLASAEGYVLDLQTPITSFGTAMTGTITTNSPALFGILALAVGFYFLWGRVRSLF